MKAFNLSMQTTVLRLYLMMVIVIAAGFLHIWPLALLALPVFLTCLLGVSFDFPTVTYQAKSRAPRVKSAISKLRLPDHQTA
jgi:hypothetical protein